MIVGLIQRCGLVSPSSRESFGVAVKWWFAGIALFGAVMVGLLVTSESANSAFSNEADVGVRDSNIQEFAGSKTADAGIIAPH